eukprot:SM000230S07340  [mRNA]  locus=s230:31324:35533:- [translate_table: standard]
MALCVSHRGLTMAAALATAVPILLLLVGSLQVADGAGCPAAGGIGATGLHELSELPLHRSKEYGPIFLDENRGILLFSVENELWRLPVNLQSSQVFDSCNFSSRTYASDDAKTPFVLNKALGLAYVAFSRNGNPGLAIIDYSGSLNEISEILFNISSLKVDPRSPKCILFDQSTAVEGIFACQQFNRQGLFFAKKDSTLTVVFVDLDATNSTLSSSSTLNLTSDGAMTVIVDPSEGMAYFGADNPPTYGKINVTSPLSTRQQEAYLLPAAESFQAVLFDNYRRFIYWATASASLPLLRSPWGSQDLNITLQSLTTGVSITSGQNLTVYSGARSCNSRHNAATSACMAIHIDGQATIKCILDHAWIIHDTRILILCPDADWSKMSLFCACQKLNFVIYVQLMQVTDKESTSLPSPQALARPATSCQNVSASPTPQAPATYPPPEAPRSSVPPGSAVPPHPPPPTKPAPMPPPKVSPSPPAILPPPPIPTPSSSPPEASPAASGPQSQVPASAPSLPAGAMSPQPALSPTTPSAAPPPESGNHSQVPVPQAPVSSTPGKSPPAPATGAADGQNVFTSKAVAFNLLMQDYM